MDKESRLIHELTENALFRMDESTRMIKKSIANLSDEELWQKPSNSLNSIANLMLHLCGNITQYVISSLGEVEDQRKRDLEFSVTGGLDKYQVFKKLEDTVDDAKRVILEASLEQLLEKRQVQGFTFSGVGVILHAVEHYSYHTGQIAFWVKQLKNIDLGFYDEMDLENK